MQQSWRGDHDKLTFIACVPVDGAPEEILAGTDDCPGRMLGDVNLFLSAADDDSKGCVGELELMIAHPASRRRGYGRAAILAFLHYIAANLQGILGEYCTSQSIEKPSLVELRVKVGSKNEKSIKLFESIGFIQSQDGPNYFDELELAFEGSIDDEKTVGLLQKYGIHGYREMPYAEASE
jgi:GNAT superfamily N-acetyltransferase